MNNKTNDKNWYKSEKDTPNIFDYIIAGGAIFFATVLVPVTPIITAVVLTLNFDKIQNYFYRDVFFFPISQASGTFGIGAFFLGSIITLTICMIIYSLGFPKSKTKFKDLPKKVQTEDIKSILFVTVFISIIFISSALCCYYAFTSGIFFEKDFLTKRSLFGVKSFNYSDIKEVKLEAEKTKAINPITYIKYSFITSQNEIVTIQEWLSQTAIDQDKLIKSFSLFKDKEIDVKVNFKW